MTSLAPTVADLLALALTGASGTAEGGVTERLEERGGSVLELADGVLTRRRGEQSLVLAAPGAELGRILDIALDPAGLCFVAADGGLFVLGPEVDVLDRIELAAGAPEGRPRSVSVDARRRVWLATERAIGPIEPSFHYGRTLDAGELPGAGPYELCAQADGTLLLRGAAGERRYEPDRGEPPCVTSVRLDERVLDGALDAELVLAFGERTSLSATGTGAGGASLRYRLDGHHVWRDLSGGRRLEALSPGSHVLEVVALDRDLNRSPPVRVTLSVPYPAVLEPRSVVLLAGVLGAAIGGSFLVRALRRGGGRERLARAAVSSLLVGVFGLQVLAGLVPHGRGWPFMGFDMYSEGYERGDTLYEALLVGLAPGGEEFLIDPQTLGFAIDDRWQALRPMIDGGEPVAREYLDAFRTRYPSHPIHGLQVQAKRTELTAEGPRAVAPLVLFHYQEPGDDAH